MKIRILRSAEERGDAQDVADWIRDGEFEADIDILIEEVE